MSKTPSGEYELEKGTTQVILLMEEILHRLGMYKTQENIGINYQPQLVSLPDFFHQH